MTDGREEQFPLGDYMRELRLRKGVSLKKVEAATGISNAYISQLENGKRRRIPHPEKLKALANYYNVSVQQLLEKAGYVEDKDIELTEEQKIEKTFQHAINDPRFHYSRTMINADNIPLDVKKFVNELYLKKLSDG